MDNSSGVKVKGDAEAARDALRELANVKMDLSLEDWCRISNTILAALAPAEAGVEANEAQMALCQLAWIEEGGKEHPHRIEIIRKALNRLASIGAEAGVEGDAKRLVPGYALDWLFGQGPDKNGQWFGDVPGKGAFWWRSQFRAMLDDAALTRPPLLEEWRDMDSAPKDGTRILACGIKHGPSVDIIEWGNGRYLGKKSGYEQTWINRPGHSVEPSGWMPLPAPTALLTKLEAGR